MKITIYVLALALAASVFMLVYTSLTPGSEMQKEPPGRFKGIEDATIVTDSQTGCKYLFTDSGAGSGLSPFYNKEGELYCGK